MGMFRDMKEGFQVLRSDELKDLKKKADAQPKRSMMDGLKMANEAMDNVPVWQQQAADMQAAMANGGVYASGVAGNATVTAISDTGTFVNNQPVMELDLTVSVPGKDPYPVKHRQLIAMSQIPNFQPGKSFPVHVDQQDATKIALG